MPPMPAPTTPDNTDARVRPGAFRSFTVPSKAIDNGGTAGSSAAGSVVPGAKDIESLYACVNVKIVAFDTPKTSLRSTPTKGSPSQDASGTLPWMYPSERTMAAGPLQIYRVISSGVCFIKSGRLLHPTMPMSQCWCVDGESKFVLRVRDDLHYRIELPFDTEDDKKDVEELKGVLAKILRYEKTQCPFKRGFHVDLPETEDSPSRIRVVESQHPKNRKRWLDGVWLPEDETVRQSSAPVGHNRRGSLFRSSTIEAADPSYKTQDSEDESIPEQDDGSVSESADARSEMLTGEPRLEMGTTRDVVEQPTSEPPVSTADTAVSSTSMSRPQDLQSIRSVTEPLLKRNDVTIVDDDVQAEAAEEVQAESVQTSAEDEDEVQAEDQHRQTEGSHGRSEDEESQTGAEDVQTGDDESQIVQEEGQAEVMTPRAEAEEGSPVEDSDLQTEDAQDEDDSASLVSRRTSFHTASGEEMPDNTIEIGDDEQPSEVDAGASSPARRPRHTRDISEITITGSTDRPTTAGDTSINSLSPPPTPTLIIDDDVDDQEWHDAVTPPDTLRLRRRPKSQLRSKSPSTVASSSATSSRAVFAPRAPETLSTTIRGKGKQFTAALIRKAYLLLTGPSADLIAIMLRIAAKIVNGTNVFHSYDLGSNMDGMAFAGAGSSARPINTDDPDDWDEDDFGIPLGNTISNASRSNSLSRDRILVRGRQRTPSEIWGISQEEESPDVTTRQQDVD